VAVENLKPPSEEEIRWVERMADLDDLLPGQSGIVAYRMRMRFEATERVKVFLRARDRLHAMQRARAVREAA
jgi:hypothetical protein